MPYITLPQAPRIHQITLDELLDGEVELKPIPRDINNTRTYYAEKLTPKFLDRYNFLAMCKALQDFTARHAELYDKPRADLYDTFYIPKKSGGLRRIDAPVPDLMEALRELKEVFETQFFAMYHTSAFAYVKGRSTLDAIKRHQNNESNWFLKTDFSDFFGSTTPEFLEGVLSDLFPFSEVMKIPSGKENLLKALDLCFLNGGLPQGTPISPMLTNLMMIPIDFRLANQLRNYDRKSFVYTRYADDIQISCRYDFQPQKLVMLINTTLLEFHAPFQIKDSKTRYGSRSGSNWNLGLMLNKDNEITVGHKNKKRFRAMVCNYILDRQNGTPWDLHDVQVLRGHINYYAMIEKDYVESVLKYNNKKFCTDVMKSIKEDLQAT